jgi:hypothetical protein
MRKLVIAAFLPLLLVGCASRPNQIRGDYAIVLDPALDPRESVGDLPTLHHLVRAALTKRLQIARTVADADAVILLKPGETPGQLVYEIRRGETLVASSAKNSLVPPRYMRSSAAFPSGNPLADAVFETGTHIAEQILYALQKL